MKSIKIEIPKGYQIDEEKSTFTNIVFKPIEKKWVDLGLPSGTLWCDTNEEGYYSWNEMMNKFDEENLPKLTDFAELYDYCDWRWNNEKKGIVVTGPNGNCIFIPASGCRGCNNGDLFGVGYYGYYWSVSLNNYNTYYMFFSSIGYVNPSGDNNRTSGRSVRCIKRTK
jgi:uncharacterized protein (TIGR02145 family)